MDPWLRLSSPMQEIRVQFLGWEDPLEEEMATHSSILSWKIPWTEEPGRLQYMGSQESDRTWQLNNNNRKKRVRRGAGPGRLLQ